MDSKKKAQIVKGLTAAKKFLWNGKDPRGAYINGKETCVCYCIANAHNKRMIDRETESHAANYVQDMISGYAFASSWLRDHVSTEERLSMTDADIQEWRLRWINHMIKELSK